MDDSLKSKIIDPVPDPKKHNKKGKDHEPEF